MNYTEYEFTLPKGLIDTEGQINRLGVMRPATGKDEINAQKDRRVRDNPDYGVLVILSQVITKFGNLSRVTPELLEQLFLIDLVYLREIYNQINQQSSELSESGEF
ncbi:MAG TPA: hypothetical protein V6C95_24225 [Coleofasciculaceae cyanobacterium]